MPPRIATLLRLAALLLAVLVGKLPLLVAALWAWRSGSAGWPMDWRSA